MSGYSRQLYQEVISIESARVDSERTVKIIGKIHMFCLGGK